jgi:hypothetical protein
VFSLQWPWTCASGEHTQRRKKRDWSQKGKSGEIERETEKWELEGTLFCDLVSCVETFLYVVFSKLTRWLAFTSVREQGCQIFLGPNLPKRKNISNDHTLCQKAVNYTKWQ